MMDQNVINMILGTAFAILGWFARELWSAVKDLKNDLAKLREELPKTYTAKEYYREDLREIKEMLGKNFDKLANKVDK